MWRTQHNYQTLNRPKVNVSFLFSVATLVSGLGWGWVVWRVGIWASVCFSSKGPPPDDWQCGKPWYVPVAHCLQGLQSGEVRILGPHSGPLALVCPDLSAAGLFWSKKGKILPHFSHLEEKVKTLSGLEVTFLTTVSWPEEMGIILSSLGHCKG